jgi:outer membrane protein assembly factor BamA
MDRGQLQEALSSQLATARFSSAEVQVVSLSDSARLEWHTQELAAVTDVEVHGSTLFTPADFLRYTAPLTNAPLSGRALVQVAGEIEGHYHTAGYPLVTVDSVYMGTDSVLHLFVDEAAIASVRVVGNKRTKTRFIESNLPNMTGEVLVESRLEQGQSALYASGLFRSVSTHTKQQSGGPELEIKVAEEDFTRLRLGLHWHDEFGAEAFGELSDVNVYGMGHKAALYGMYGGRRQHIQVSLGADRLANTYLTYKLRFYHRREEWRLYVLSNELPFLLRFHRTGGRLEVGQQLRRFGLLSAGLRVEEIDDFLDPEIKTSKWNLRTVYLQAELDTFDRFPLPRSGYRQRLVLEHATKQMGGNTQYTKFWAEIDAVLPLGRHHVAILGGSAGTADTRLIEPERFVLGGRSFLGLITGEGRGDHYWSGHAALRLHNGGPRYITLQYNLGNIWPNGARIDLLEVIHGVGVAYTIDSPAGPLDFAVGLATDREVVGYINLGLPF